MPGGRRGEGIVGELGMDIYTLLYLKWITNKDLLYSRVLSSIVCDSLDGRGVWRRMDTWICMADSLWYSPETVTALLIGYAPIQNKKLKKYLLYQGLYKDDEKTNYRLGENICKHPI